MRSSTRSSVTGWLLVGPALLFFAVFSVYPLVAGVGLSFMKQVGPISEWVGLANYRALFGERALRSGIVNTLLYVAICVPPIVVIPALVALMAHGFHRLGILVAFAFYLPGLSTAPILAIVWRWVFAPDGLVNGILVAAGAQPIMWLGQIPQAFITVCGVVIFSNLGTYVVLYLIAERNIPASLYEIAALDGCSPIQRTWYVTLPAMAPVMGAVTIMATIGMFQIWIIPNMLCGGGPLYSTTTVLLDLYNNAWGHGRIGVASAEGVCLMVVIAVVALAQARYVWRAV